MKKYSIICVRGDTKHVSIPEIKYSDGTLYTLTPTDHIYLDVKKSASDNNKVLIHKDITSADYTDDGVLTFTFKPSETAKLSRGEYVFDVRLYIDEDNIFTIITESTMLIVNNITEIPEGVD